MKFKYILSAFVGGALTLGAASCTDEVEYTPADQVAGEGFYLSETGTADISIEENATYVTIPVYRTNTSGVATVAIESAITDEDGNPVTGIFTVPSEATFADGAKESMLEVGVDFSKVEALAVYDLSLKLLTDQTTPYSQAECVYSLSYAPWTEWDFYSATDPGFMQFTTIIGNGIDVPVIIRWSEVEKTLVQFGIPNLFGDCHMEYIFTMKLTPDNLYNPDGLPNADEEYLASLTGDDLVDISKLKMNYYVTLQPNDTEIDGLWVTDIYNYITSIAGYSPAETEQIMAQNGWSRAYYNPSIGRVNCMTVPYLTDGRWAPTAISWEYLQLPGIFKDYSLGLAYAGNFIDNDFKEKAIINVTRSKDVVSFAYKVEKGKLTDEQIKALEQQIINDPDIELITEDNTISISLEEAGVYTVVAVGYDSKSVNVTTANTMFYYETAQQDNPWTTLGMCEYTDGFLVDFYGGKLGGETWEVEIQEHNEQPGLYRLVNPYNRGWGPIEQYGKYWTLLGRYYLVINAVNPNAVYVETSPLGIMLSSEDGQIVASSVAGNNIDKGQTLQQQIDAGVCGTLEDGVITMPAQSLITAWIAESGKQQIGECPKKPLMMVDMSFLDAKAPMKAARNKSSFNPSLPNAVRHNAVESNIKLNKRTIKSSTFTREPLKDCKNRTLVKFSL